MLNLDKKLILKMMAIASCLSLLSSCTTTQVKVGFPTPPGELMLLPPKLQPLPNDAKLSTAEGVIVDNYTAYQVVSEQLIELQSWIKEQTKIK